MVRSWRIHRQTGATADDLARWMNPVIRGWMNYYGRFRRSALSPLLLRVNTYLARWAQRKYKGLRAHKRLRAWWERFVAANPTGFAHWQWMRHTCCQDEKSRVTGDCHARIRIQLSLGSPLARPQMADLHDVGQQIAGVRNAVRAALAGRLSRPVRLGDGIEDVFGHGPGLGTVLDYVEVRRWPTSPLESQSSVDLGSLPLPTSTFREARVSGSSTGRELGGRALMLP